MTFARWLSPLLAALFLVVLPPASDPGAQTQDAECSDPGERLPVLLVHGFTADPSTFDGPNGVGAKLAENEEAHVDRFDYSNRATEWVTDGIGDDLAAHILCLGDRSDEGGGPGRVVVVGHSMGGLATRAASTVEGVPERLGLVITLGTPHRGSYWAGPREGLVRTLLETILDAVCGVDRLRDPLGPALLCEPRERINTPAGRALARGSEQLNALPPFPADVPVLAVAGDVLVKRRFLFYDLPIAHLGDMIVETGSATAHHQHEDRGGGRKVIECRARPITAFLKGLLSNCYHGRLASGPRGAAQVARAVGRAVEDLRPPDLELHVGGIGPHPLAGAAEPVLAELHAALGDPTDDTGWALEPCTETHDVREVRYEAFSLHLERDDRGETLAGWSYRPQEGALPEGLHLSVPLGQGSTWADVAGLGGRWDAFYNFWEIRHSDEGPVFGEVAELGGAESDPPPQSPVSLVTVGSGEYLAGC